MFRAWWVFLLWLFHLACAGCGSAPEALRGTTADGAVWFAQVEGDEATIVECRPDAQPRCVQYAPVRVTPAQLRAWRGAHAAGAITAASGKAQYEGVIPVPIPPVRGVPGGLI